MTAAPEGYTSVAPWIVTKDTAGLLDFITNVFEGVDAGLVRLEDGSVGHAEIRIGDTVVLAFDQRADWPDRPSLLRVFVPDADATYAKALSAGARAVTEPTTAAFGQRGGRVLDPFGNIWWITTHVEDVAPEEGLRRLQEPTYQRQMQYAQETLDAELAGRRDGRSSAVVKEP